MNFHFIEILKVNFEKTNVILIGALKYSTQAIKTKYKLSWGTTQIKVVGIIFDVDLDSLIMLNFNDKLEKVKE